MSTPYSRVTFSISLDATARVFIATVNAYIPDTAAPGLHQLAHQWVYDIKPRVGVSDEAIRQGYEVHQGHWGGAGPTKKEPVLTSATFHNAWMTTHAPLESLLRALPSHLEVQPVEFQQLLARLRQPEEAA